MRQGLRASGFRVRGYPQFARDWDGGLPPLEESEGLAWSSEHFQSLNRNAVPVTRT